MFVLDGPSFFCVPQHSQGGRENLPAGKKKMSPLLCQSSLFFFCPQARARVWHKERRGHFEFRGHSHFRIHVQGGTWYILYIISNIYALRLPPVRSTIRYAGRRPYGSGCENYIFIATRLFGFAKLEPGRQITHRSIVRRRRNSTFSCKFFRTDLRFVYVGIGTKIFRSKKISLFCHLKSS